jgi:hypothetical protein
VWPVSDRLFGAPSKSATGARAPLAPPKGRPYIRQCMCIKEVFDTISEKEITRHSQNSCYVSTLKTVLCNGKCTSINRKVLKEILHGNQTKALFLFGHDPWLVIMLGDRGRINQYSTSAGTIMCPLPKTARTTCLHCYIPEG